MNTLLSGKNVDTVSPTFRIGKQVTIVALGLEVTDEVTVWMVLPTDPVKNPCSCPPGAVVLPSVLDEQQLPTCCGEGFVTLTRARPYVVLDAPQDVLLRVKLDTATLNTQWVGYGETTTEDLNDYLRGCPCAIEGEG